MSALPENGRTQRPFRPEDPALLGAIDAYAASIRRSSNMTMTLLLEEALRAHGFWPPPEPEAEAPATRKPRKKPSV